MIVIKIPTWSNFYGLSFDISGGSSTFASSSLSKKAVLLFFVKRSKTPFYGSDTSGESSWFTSSPLSRKEVLSSSIDSRDNSASASVIEKWNASERDIQDC